jgi:hypothetical protein
VGAARPAAIVCTVAAALGDTRSWWLAVSAVSRSPALAEGRASRRVPVPAATALAVAAAAPRVAADHGAGAQLSPSLALWTRDKMRLPWLPALLFAAASPPSPPALSTRRSAARSLAAAAPARLRRRVAPVRRRRWWSAHDRHLASRRRSYGAWLRVVPDGERKGERLIGYRHSLALCAPTGRATAS